MPARAIKIFLTPDRDELLRRIDARFDAMMAAGALDEVQLARGARARARPAGHEGARRALARSPPRRRDHARAGGGGAKRDTRQYTKRQATWFRNQLPDFAWVEPDRALTVIEAQLRGLAEVTQPPHPPCGRASKQANIPPGSRIRTENK